MTAYRYTECGLENVVIEGIATMTDDDGDEVIQIPYVNALHRAIAEAILEQSSSMAGKELRFLRSEMGFTQAELGEIVNVDKQTVGRWERDETPINGAAETIIRKMAGEKLIDGFGVKIEDLARSFSKEDANPHEINIRATEDGYERIAA